MNITFLDKIISREDIVEDTAPGIGNDHHLESSSRITSRGQILRLLTRVYENHQLVTVELEFDDTQHSSLILEINEKENYMVLDEFYPKIAPEAVTLKSRLKFYTFISGIELNFVSSIEAVAEFNNEPYYKVPVPEKVLYFQKRQFLRVPVSLSNPVRVVLSDNASLISNGELRDLSVGGFSARMNLDDIAYSVGDVLPRCMLHMPADKKIFCSAEIRQIDPAEGNRLPRIGARFVDMGKADLKQIEKFVAEVDRELVRRFRQ